MSNFVDNVYYSPDKCGLEIVESFDDPDASYSFNMFVVWRKLDDGRLFYASDSGCSCPSPFEDYHTLGSLTEITRAGFGSFKSDFDGWRKSHQYDDKGDDGEGSVMATKAEALDLFDKVARLLDQVKS